MNIYLIKQKKVTFILANYLCWVHTASLFLETLKQFFQHETH